MCKTFAVLLFTLVFSSFSIYSQTIEATANDCGTISPSSKESKKLQLLMQQAYTNKITNQSVPISIPVKIHIIRHTNGSGGIANTIITDAMALMNARYAPANLNFSICGPIHYMDDSDLYNLNLDVSSYTLSLNNVNDAINVYFAESIQQNSGTLNGITEFPSGDALKNLIIIKNSAVSNGSTLAHEMGHYWFLYHTHEIANGSELVNGSNCSSAGDLICDTPADTPFGNYTTNPCAYVGTAKDANNQPYSPLVNNILSSYTQCRTSFTQGQYDRMAAGYITRLNLMSSSGEYTFNCSSFVSVPTDLQLNALATCKIDISWTDNASNERGYIIEWATSPSGPFKAVARVLANTNAYSFSSETGFVNGQVYYFRVIAANANSNYSSVASITYAQPTCESYCVIAFSNCNDDDMITKVKIDNETTTIFENTSTCSPTGYSYHHTPAIDLTAGVLYTITLNKPHHYADGAQVWIDYNNNRIFESNELILTQTPTDWASIYNAFTIPSTIAAGNTRMRVRLGYNTLPDACSSYQYSETEDYLINIITCPSTINLVNNQQDNISAGSFEKKAAEYINASNTITGGQVNYRAGKSILLNEGFMAIPSTGYFKAEIGGCN